MSDWELIDVKSVKDSDGFWTDYTMWYNAATDEWVCIFGDRDLYDPYNSDYDYECETEEECREWFDSYTGFDDEEDVWAATSVGATEITDNLDIILGELGRNVSKLRKLTWSNLVSNEDLSALESSIHNMNEQVKSYIRAFDL